MAAATMLACVTLVFPTSKRASNLIIKISHENKKGRPQGRSRFLRVYGYPRIKIGDVFVGEADAVR
jgi:hypothetical protein